MSASTCRHGHEPLVLIHGIGASSADFSAILPYLSGHFDVIATELPGHGSAAAMDGRPTVAALTDAIEQQLDALGLDTVHCVGNSLGGRVALELAVRDRARSIVAIAPSGLAGPIERPLQSAVLVGAGIALRTLRQVAPGVTGHAIGRAVVLAGMRARPWRASRDEADAVLRGFGTRSYWSTLLWGVVMDVPHDLGQIRCPVHLVQGSNDLLAGMQVISYAASIPGARLTIVPFAGHAAQGDNPARIAEIVRATAGRVASVVEEGAR